MMEMDAMPTPYILIVDDHADVLDLMTTFIESTGMAVAQASDGVDAISCLYARRPALVLVDMMMPRMDGLELISQIRSDRNLAALPIIAMSGTSEMLMKARQSGANGSLQKPISRGDIQRMIENFVDGGIATQR
jgi:CheY-like chemotaxis protein